MSETEGQGERSMTTSAVERILARVRHWRQARDELGGIDRGELERIAAELGMGSRELEDLVARGPGAADLLHERMNALGITRVDAERLGQGMMRDLERACACCCAKGACGKDLAQRPDDPAWKGYCPNAATLESIRSAKDR